MIEPATLLVGDHSLRGTLRRVSDLDPYLASGVGRDPRRDPVGWITPAELCRPDGVALERLLGAIGAHAGTAERRVQASFLVGSYAWYVLAPVLGAYLAERRVPCLAHDNAALWLDAGDEPGCLALRTGRFTAIGWDPAAGSRGVALVSHGAALRDVLHDEIVCHMTPIIAALRARTPLGARAQWLEVADRVATGLHHVGQAIGDPERAIREAEALVQRPDSPLHAPRGRFASYEHLGQRRTLRLRAGCCLTYRIAGHGYCLTCPLVGEEERAVRVQAWLTDELAQAT